MRPIGLIFLVALVVELSLKFHFQTCFHKKMRLPGFCTLKLLNSLILVCCLILLGFLWKILLWGDIILLTFISVSFVPFCIAWGPQLIVRRINISEFGSLLWKSFVFNS